MCGRFNEHLPKMHGWAEALKSWPTDHERRYNRPPTTNIAAFRGEVGEMMRWGMVPPWSKTLDSKYATFNASVESAAEKPTFRNASKSKKHCLIPMAGYYEWIKTPDGKQPVYISDPNNGCIVTAGLWEESQGQLSCTVITKPSDGELEPIHPRMPIMLNIDQAEAWLAGEIDALELKRPNLIYFPVSKAVGNVRNDSPDLIEPID